MTADELLARLGATFRDAPLGAREARLATTRDPEGDEAMLSIEALRQRRYRRGERAQAEAPEPHEFTCVFGAVCLICRKPFDRPWHVVARRIRPPEIQRRAAGLLVEVEAS